MCLITSINGVVLGVEKSVAKCELYVEEGEVIIWLPLTLFCEPVTYGLPFSLKLIEEDRGPKLVVSVRKLDPEKMKSFTTEMEALIKML